MSVVPVSRHLDIHEMRSRAVRTRLVLTDVDGTLTDGGVYYSERGEEMKRFNLRDGMGVERLRERGIHTAFVTRESSVTVRCRAEKLHVRLYEGLRDKTRILPDILAASGLTIDQLAYIGDDVNDLGIMRAILPSGLVSAPADAQTDVRLFVHHVCTRRGGHGAFREFAELLIELANPVTEK